MLDFADDRFRVGINYTPLYSLYPPKDSIYSPLPGDIGCELINKSYEKGKADCLYYKNKFKTENHNDLPSFIEYMSNNCKKFNIQIK